MYAFVCARCHHTEVFEASGNDLRRVYGPGERLPVSKNYRCAYVIRYLQVAQAYDLPITDDDFETARQISAVC